MASLASNSHSSSDSGTTTLETLRGSFVSLRAPGSTASERETGAAQAPNGKWIEWEAHKQRQFGKMKDGNRVA